MKTSIKSLIAAVLTAVVLIGSAVATKAADGGAVTVLSEVKKVNSINVSGNVKLILVQSAEESVKVYDSYFSKNALVQQKDGELRISSFNKETLTVVVYVTNLSAITAANNATVSTYGILSAPSLSVDLKDQATANLNTNTYNLYTNLGGQANLTLKGETTEYSAVMGNMAKVNMTSFNAANTAIQTKNISIAKVAVPAEFSISDLYNL